MDELNQQLSDYNNQTVHLHASLSTLPLDCERVDYIVLELESELFDVSVFHYRCQMLAREKVQVLKEREKDLSCLQANMELLSQSLKNAQDLLSQKDSITNVQDYLNQCKVSITYYYNNKLYTHKEFAIICYIYHKICNFS